MCCILGFVKWTFGCIHRSLTFLLGFWLLLTVVYACAFAVAAGVAYGYDYCLAEYTTLANKAIDENPEQHPKLERLVRRSGDPADLIPQGREFELREWTENTPRHTAETKPLPNLWFYESPRKYSDWLFKPSFHRVSSYPRHTTENVNIDKVSEVSETVADANLISDPSTSMSNVNVSESAKPEITTTVAGSASMRLFTPNRDKFWPYGLTKPDKQFFYKTPGNKRRKTMKSSYYPEMKLRLFNQSLFGKYEGQPMRHWDTTNTIPQTEINTEDYHFRGFF